jgi:hypothetical protein
VLSDALGHSFDSFDAVEFFVRNRAGEFLGLVDERKLLVGPGGQPGDSLATSIRLYREEIQQWRSSDHQKRLAKLSDSAFVFNGLCERIGPMYHLFENAEELIANPLMPLAVHWYYYRLCSRFFEHRLQKLALLDPRVMAEMQALENTTFEWLGMVPIDALVELRLRGENDIFRTRMRDYTARLQDASLDDLNRVASEVSRAISSLVLEHQNTIRAIQEKYSRHAIHNVLLAGITVAATIIPTLAPVVGAAPLLLPLGKIAWDKVSERLDKKQASRSLMGVLAEARRNVRT